MLMKNFKKENSIYVLWNFNENEGSHGPLGGISVCKKLANVLAGFS